MNPVETQKMFNKVKLLRKPIMTLQEKDDKYGVNNMASYNVNKDKSFYKDSAFKKFVESNPSVFASGGKKKKSKKMMKEEKIMNVDAQVSGAGFWDDFATGFKQGFSGVMDVAKTVAPLLPLVGLGKEEKKRGRPKKNQAVQVEVEIKKMVKPDKSAFESSSEEEVKMDAGKKKKKGLNDKMKRRMDKVKEIMADRKCSMIDASKIIKKEGLDY
jgi:hypothetical protein